MTRSCARRSFAAETIFMALVICCVLRTDRIRRRMSIRLGIAARGLLLLRGETLFELFHRAFQLAAQRVIQGFLFPNLRPDGGMGIIDIPVKPLFEFPAAFDGQIVQESAGSGEDNGHLLLDWKRLKLFLLENLNQPAAAI